MACPIFDVGGVLYKIAITGGTALSLLFAFKSKFPSSLFSYHPTLLGIGWLAITPLAIKFLRESKKETKKEAKVEKVKLHGYLNGAAFAACLGGLYAIFKNKENMAAAKKQVAKHLVSPHAQLGAVSTALTFVALLISFYKTYLEKNVGTADYTWRNKLHRIVGMLAYVTAGLAIILIVNGPWGHHNLGKAGKLAVSIVLSLVQSIVVSAYLWG